MVITIDQSSAEPLYQQIGTQIIAAIARGELVPGDALPSVRSLASDLGINLHTVAKAYAVLRDEGYVVMHRRSGAVIADRRESVAPWRGDEQDAAMREELLRLARAYKARGGSAAAFAAELSQVVDAVFCDIDLRSNEEE